MKSITIFTSCAALVAAGFGAGCSSSTSPNTQRGALGGAAAGAVLGGIIGHQSGEAGKGAAIGAAAGGIAGAAIGNQRDRRVENETTAVTSADAQSGYYVQHPPLAPTSMPQESVPPRPSPQAVWIPGYYAYTAQMNQPYQWVPGHWEIPPPGATTWVQPRWQPSGDGYVYVRGHWQ